MNRVISSFFCANFYLKHNNNYIYLDSLEEYFKYVFKFKLDFYSYTDSSEHFYHYQLYLFSFIGKLKNKLISFLEEYDNKNPKNNMLKDFTYIFDTKLPFLKTAFIESNYERNVFFNEKYVEYLIKNKILKILNIDYINKVRKINKMINYVSIPDYFDIEIYRNHSDLKDYDDTFLVEHFLNNGQYESRDYKRDNYLLPIFIREFLLKCNNLIEFFDVPEDFMVYSYKEKNVDLQQMGYYELMNHYVDKGKSQGKKY